jgi:hypothetical protein
MLSFRGIPEDEDLQPRSPLTPPSAVGRRGTLRRVRSDARDLTSGGGLLKEREDVGADDHRTGEEQCWVKLRPTYERS